MTEDRILASQTTAKRAAKILNRSGINVFLAVYAVTAIYPIVWMIYSSFKTQQEFAINIFSLPAGVNWNNYLKIFQQGVFFRSFFNSFFASSVAVIFVVLFSFIIAYVLARYNFKGRNFLYIFFLFGLMVPVYALLVPVFLQFKYLGLLDNQFTIIPPLIGFEMSGCIFLFESYIRSIPTEIEEAAFIDGASTNKILTSIIFPICSPMAITILILSFLGTWNAFAFPLILIRSQHLKTIPLWLNSFQGERSTDYTSLMAALVLASIPIILLYTFFSEKIMQGMIAGAVRG